MSIGIDNFRDEYLNNDKTLKEEYILLYSSSPAFPAIPHNITLLIYNDLSFEIKLVWYKFPFEGRIYSIYKSNFIPENVIETLNELNKIEHLKLQELYSTYTGKYVPDDSSHDSYYFNHRGETFSVNMSSYLKGESLFVSDHEKIVLKFYKQLKNWKEHLYEKITNIHE
ncbi:hypothetical protein [Flavobacterium sp.]|uniref:hypothetical protein n=1 Tax=Flavobacterium sp. TaxID=239 RepID=UPI002B4AD292|nr:hypothetical protein [Flavobacterium sp.]HLP63138.1 hypothetical protein [Flavobacterium sp.]